MVISKYPWLASGWSSCLKWTFFSYNREIHSIKNDNDIWFSFVTIIHDSQFGCHSTLAGFDVCFASVVCYLIFHVTIRAMTIVLPMDRRRKVIVLQQLSVWADSLMKNNRKRSCSNPSYGRPLLIENIEACLVLSYKPFKKHRWIYTFLFWTKPHWTETCELHKEIRSCQDPFHSFLSYYSRLSAWSRFWSSSTTADRQLAPTLVGGGGAAAAGAGCSPLIFFDDCLSIFWNFFCSSKTEFLGISIEGIIRFTIRS